MTNKGTIAYVQPQNVIKKMTSPTKKAREGRGCYSSDMLMANPCTYVMTQAKSKKEGRASNPSSFVAINIATIPASLKTKPRTIMRTPFFNGQYVQGNSIIDNT